MSDSDGRHDGFYQPLDYTIASATATYQPYTVAFYWTSFAGRQLATVSSARKQTELIHFIEDNNGSLEGEWYHFASEDDFHKAIIRTRELGGIVYDLPVKTGM
ncbi:hypothetical protein BDZ97DRAFT_1753607 [Flammula alnicola]|nr:hypothetical protein BDZ97DRAFT_1753607 [Flammula alnicola]